MSSNLPPVPNLTAPRLSLSAAARAQTLRNIGLKGVAGALGALGRAAARRVDLLMMGDSHQNFDGLGYLNGFGAALGARFGVYATGVMPVLNGYTHYQQQGPNIFGSFLGASGVNSGAPAGYDAYRLTDKHPYLYQGDVAMGNGNGAILLAPGNAFELGRDGNLRAHFAYGTFAAGGGTMRPCWRLDQPPYTNLAISPTIACQTGAVGLAVGTLDLPAAIRANDITFHWQSGTLDATVPPTIEFWHRIENMDRQSGVALTTLFAEGGASAWDAASWLASQSDAQIRNMLRAVRHLQEQAGQDPLVVLYLCFGHNDQGEGGLPTLGPLALASGPASALAFVDNHRSIYNRVRAVWDANWPRENLTFLVMPSHPASMPDSAALVAYRAALARFAAGKSDVSLIDLTSLMTSDDIARNGGFDAPGYDFGSHSSGNVHAAPAAYDYIAQRVVGELVVAID